MSATGRGTNRDPKDFYATPRPAFAPLLDVLPRDVIFWEPCAGDGRLIKWLNESGRPADGADLYPQVFGDLTPLPAIDFLADTTQRDFVITNPPFSITFEMCQHAIKYSREFMFLLRLSFLESDERGEWFTGHEPAGLHVLKKRPSFVMSITCKSVVREKDQVRVCKHNWLLPIESPRPKVCQVCGGDKLAISTSDSSGYVWLYWGNRPELCGIHHI